MKTAFIHANVLDVLEKKVCPDCTVLVENGIITAIGPQTDTRESRLVDLKGAYLSPGLFNCHVHITSSTTNDPSMDKASVVGYTLASLENLRTFIQTGVTFVRDVGEYGTIATELRDAIRVGRVKMAPDMQVAGHPICMTGGTTWNFVGYQADGVDECRKAARLMLREGADWIKLMGTGAIATRGVEPGCTQLGEDELRAAVVEGHKVGVRSSCHVQNIEGAKNAIRAGVDCLEHGFRLDEEAVAMMLEKGTWLVPTVSVPSSVLRGEGKGMREEFVRKARQMEAYCYDSFRRAYNAGVPCALGSDVGTPMCLPEETAREMVVMVEQCGLDPFDALAIGTINSARLCRVDKELGSITVGKKAHFAIFAENPAQDIRAAQNCLMTVKNGEILWQK